MLIEYTPEPDDVGAARLLAIGIRPRIEFSLFAAALLGLAADKTGLAALRRNARARVSGNTRARG